MDKINPVIPNAILFIAVILIFVSVSVASEPIIEFLSVEEGQAKIIDEVNRPYFSRLQTLEMTVKTGSEIIGETLEEQREECKKRFQAGVLEFTAEEQEVISWFVKKLHPLLEKDYPKFANTPWKFVKLSKTIEGGVPHTRSDVIILSDMISGFFCKAMQSANSNESAEDSIVNIIGEIFIHEKMHVYQYLNLDKFEKFYQEVLDFERVEYINVFEDFDLIQLINPDGPKVEWALRGKPDSDETFYMTFLTFEPEVEVIKIPHDIAFKIIHLIKTENGFRAKLDNSGQPIITGPYITPEYMDHFPLTMQDLVTDESHEHRHMPVIYHPNEIITKMFSIIFSFDNFIPAHMITAERKELVKSESKIYREFFSKAL